MILRQRSKVAIAILIALILVAGTASVAMIWNLQGRDSNQINDPSIPISPQISTQDDDAAKMIQLPGAEPITALTGDYAQDDHLWRLVNKTHALNDPQYRPHDLQFASVPSRTNKSTDERSLRRDIMPYVEMLFAAADEAGFSLHIGSGFRSYDLQDLYYTNYRAVYGQAAADSFSTKPGYSEHQTGLAMDVSTVDNYCYLEECFGDTPAGVWLAKHAHEYGFILRYPQGKDGITDFTYEPWHFRYIGTDLAKALVDSGLTLDEAWTYMAE